MCQSNPTPLFHHYQLVLCTQVMVVSWIHVIYANFAAHYQHARTETRIRQSVWILSNLNLMIMCLLLSHYLILSQAWSSTVVHLLQHAKSCLFRDALLHVTVSAERCCLQTCSPPVGWNKSCHFPPISLITKAFLPSWWRLTAATLARLLGNNRHCSK